MAADGAQPPAQPRKLRRELTDGVARYRGNALLTLAAGGRNASRGAREPQEEPARGGAGGWTWVRPSGPAGYPTRIAGMRCPVAAYGHHA